ncbi:MAG TPA: glycosyltransferase family 4 protein [Pyrinomonadaceae bacterium]|nr:glycosyltransferase family 4 protein [Pyrinomonadaceae bacterium]
MKILWLKTELLHPVDKGGKIRTYHLLKHLKTNHHITYLTLDDGAAPPEAVTSATEYCHDLIRIPHLTRPKFSAGFYAELALNIASPLPYAILKYKSEAMTRAITETTSKDGFDVVVSDFLAPAVNLPRDLQTPVVLFQHNVEAEIWRRHYEVQQNPLKRRYLYWQWRKMQRFERDACRRVDSVIAVSEADSKMMEREYGVAKVYDIPTGVDVDFFKRKNGAIGRVNSLVFTGSMDWLPNQDAMRYFIDDILPIVRQRIPDVHLTIVGRNPYPSLIELAQRDPGITVTGRVDDVRGYIEEAVAFIVPIRIGGGTRLKIYEAMAMETPVISTTIGAEGLPLHDSVHLRIADDPEAFAAAVVKVLSDSAFAARLGTSAAQLVRQNFGWSGVAATLAELCRASIVTETSNITHNHQEEPLQSVY